MIKQVRGEQEIACGLRVQRALHYVGNQVGDLFLSRVDGYTRIPWRN